MEARKIAEIYNQENAKQNEVLQNKKDQYRSEL